MQPGTVAGAIFEFLADRCRLGTGPGINDPLTTAVFDTSGSGNHGTLTDGGGTYDSGYAGTGTLADPYRLSLDGSCNVRLPDLGACEDKVFTYEAWVKTTDTGGFLVAEQTSGGDSAILSVASSKGALTLAESSIPETKFAYTSANVNDDTWHHLVGTCDGTTIRLYKNGVVTANTALIPAGAITTNVTWLGYGLIGSLAVARIYPTALSAADVATNYAAGYMWQDAPSRAGMAPELDDSLYSIIVGNDTIGRRDITDEASGFTCSNVRPGGAASASFTHPADIWALGYNEVRPDSRLIASYDGEVFWDGIILPRGLSYVGE